MVLLMIILVLLMNKYYITNITYYIFCYINIT